MALDPMMAALLPQMTGNPWMSLLPLMTGAGNLATSRLDMADAERAAGMADPWAPNRGQYQDFLNTFMHDPTNGPMQATVGTTGALGELNRLRQDPSSITSMPGYQYGLNQSLEAVNRAAGASGMLGSGNRLAALQDRGEGYARQWYNDTYNQLLQNINANIGAGNQFLNAQGQQYGQLANLAGVNAGSPVAAANALVQGRQQQANSIGAGLSGVGAGLAGLLPYIQGMLGGGSGLPGSLPNFGSSGGFSGLPMQEIPTEVGPGGSLYMTPFDPSASDFLSPGQFVGGGGDIFNLIDVIGG